MLSCRSEPGATEYLFRDDYTVHSNVSSIKHAGADTIPATLGSDSSLLNNTIFDPGPKNLRPRTQIVAEIGRLREQPEILTSRVPAVRVAGVHSSVAFFFFGWADSQHFITTTKVPLFHPEIDFKVVAAIRSALDTGSIITVIVAGPERSAKTAWSWAQIVRDYLHNHGQACTAAVHIYPPPSGLHMVWDLVAYQGSFHIEQFGRNVRERPMEVLPAPVNPLPLPFPPNMDPNA